MTHVVRLHKFRPWQSILSEYLCLLLSRANTYIIFYFQMSFLDQAELAWNLHHFCWKIRSNCNQILIAIKIATPCHQKTFPIWRKNAMKPPEPILILGNSTLEYWIILQNISLYLIYILWKSWNLSIRQIRQRISNFVLLICWQSCFYYFLCFHFFFVKTIWLVT